MFVRSKRPKLIEEQQVESEVEESTVMNVEAEQEDCKEEVEADPKRSIAD